MIKVTSYHYYVEAGYGPFARLTDVTKTVRVWPHGETFKLNVLHGQRHEAVVLLDVPLEDVRARPKNSLEPRPVQLDTLERPHGSDGGSSGPVQHESDLSEVVGGSEDAHLLAVLALVPELGDGGVPATVHGHHHHTSHLSGFNVIEAVRAKLLQSGRRSCLANSVNFLYFWFLEMTLYYFREENFLNSWPTFVLFEEFSFYLSLTRQQWYRSRRPAGPAWPQPGRARMRSPPGRLPPSVSPTCPGSLNTQNISHQKEQREEQRGELSYIHE